MSDLGIVIVTYESQEVLHACLESLQQGLANLSAFVVVVDNGSKDQSREMARSFSLVDRVIDTGSNLGYSAAINIGVAQLNDGLDVLILNPDVRLQPGSIAELLSERSRGGIIVPVIESESGAIDLTARRFPSAQHLWAEALFGGSRTGECVTALDVYNEGGPIDWAVGAAWLVTSECRAAVGQWDESYFLYSEEVDYAFRASELGFGSVLAPKSRVVHLRGDAHHRADLWALLQINRWRYAKKHSSGSAWSSRLALIAYSLLRSPTGASHRHALKVMVTGKVPVIDSTNVLPSGMVLFSGFDWWYHSHAHADFQVATRIAQNRPVLFVNSIGLRMPTPGKTATPAARILKKLRSMTRYLTRPEPGDANIWIHTPVSIPAFSGGLVSRFNAWSVERQIRWAMKRAGIRNASGLVCLPSFGTIAVDLGVSPLLYYRYDKHSGFREADSEVVARMETDLIERCDRVLYSSRLLMEEEQVSSDKAEFFDHGVDLELFGIDVEASAEITDIAGPRIGFFGMLRDHSIDFDLLQRIAVEFPDAQLLLVGGVQGDISQLEQHPNIHFLGAREHSEIPAIGAGFDVAILPLLCNEFSRYQNPIKLKEYLALGLSVVSTELPEVRAYSDVVRIASDSEDFVEQLCQALAEGPLVERSTLRAHGRESSWDDRSQRLADLLDSLD